jgi:flavin-dependent dehydrogenase
MKVAIVGAGITGLYLAKKLSEKKVNVTVFEKEKKIPKKACSGLISERIFDFLPEAENLIENRIDFCLIHFPKKEIKIYFSKKFFVFDHLEINQLLFNLVKKKVKIFFGYNIKNLTILSLKKAFDKIIGCDGANSQVRKFLKLKEPEFYLGIQGFLKRKDYSNFVETWPTKNGFIWKIPRGKEVEYGILEKPKKAKEIFENFKKEKNLKLERENSALISQGFLIPKDEKITLCGDAASLTKPWSGGGVIWGLMAANLLLKNFPDFLKYQREMKKFFSLNIAFSKLAKNLVYFLGFNFPYFLPKKFKIDGDFLI